MIRKSLSDETKRKIGMRNKIIQDARQSPIMDRILAMTLKTETCWLWTGRIRRDGYAEISFQGKAVPVHRLSYVVFVGPIPKGMNVCHKCDVRHCCNPDHLFIGTQKDNIVDASKKGRLITGDKHHMRSNLEVKQRIADKQRGVPCPQRAQFGPRPGWIRQRMREGRLKAKLEREKAGKP